VDGIAMKEYAQSFYKSAAWKRCRGAYFKHRFGLCERCPAPGKIVHHKEYITPQNISDPNITLAFENLELLCQDCHNKEHFKRFNMTRHDVMFDDHGNLIKKEMENIFW
jgi:5-methylcytosine-specific restriction endonuclease McrA